MKKTLLFGLNLGVFMLIAYTIYLLILLSLPYIYFERDIEFLATKQLIYHIDIWRYSFYIHVFSSPVIIISGLLQFNKWLIWKRPKVHRLLGTVYIATLLFVSGPAAFVMSLYANSGRIAQTSFVLLTLAWIGTTYLAYREIRQGKTESHVKWMIRSFALTLSAVTLRFYAYLFDIFNVDIGPRETYMILSYISWIPNLIFAQLLIYLGYPKFLMNAKN